MSCLFISSTSIDENDGSARIIIEGGTITVPANCDDPIVELFRPIRAENLDKLLFVILTRHYADRIVCTIIPSNKRDRPQEELVAIATKLLKGSSENEGIIKRFETILELYFSEPNGLETYLQSVKDGDFENCDESIKSFVADLGMKMPSFKRPKKSRAEKRASSKAYLAEHPEINSKKPAN